MRWAFLRVLLVSGLIPGVFAGRSNGQRLAYTMAELEDVGALSLRAQQEAVAGRVSDYLYKFKRGGMNQFSFLWRRTQPEMAA